jgi:hypothetical protein
VQLKDLSAIVSEVFRSRDSASKFAGHTVYGALTLTLTLTLTLAGHTVYGALGVDPWF